MRSVLFGFDGRDRIKTTGMPGMTTTQSPDTHQQAPARSMLDNSLLQIFRTRWIEPTMLTKERRDGITINTHQPQQRATGEAHHRCRRISDCNCTSNPAKPSSGVCTLALIRTKGLALSRPACSHETTRECTVWHGSGLLPASISAWALLRPAAGSQDGSNQSKSAHPAHVTCDQHPKDA